MMRPSSDYSAFDVFCGIGGLAFGLHSAGIKVVGGLDVDESCRYAFETNCDAPFLQGDIRSVAYADIHRLIENATYRILVGCAPCQPFSAMANSSRKKSSSQWSLVAEFSRLIHEGRPHVVFMENVPRLINRQPFQEFVASLLRWGYSVAHKVVACSEYGVPQTRRRLILLASRLGPITIPPPKLGQRKTVRQTIEHLPHLQHGGTDSRDLLHRCSGLNAINMERIHSSLPGGTWKDWPRELLPNCYRRQSGQSFLNVYGRMQWDDLAPTLTTQFYRYGTGRFGHPEQDRAISLREGALLQTFPKRYSFVSPGGAYSFEKLGRHIGNAVPPELAKDIGCEIVKHLKEHSANE